MRARWIERAECSKVNLVHRSLGWGWRADKTGDVEYEKDLREMWGDASHRYWLPGAGHHLNNVWDGAE